MRETPARLVISEILSAESGFSLSSWRSAVTMHSRASWFAAFLADINKPSRFVTVENFWLILKNLSVTMCHMFSESIQKKIGKCKDSFDQGQAGGRSNCRSPGWQTKTKNRFFRKQEQSNDKSGFADPKPQYRRNDRRKYSSKIKGEISC